uniref:ATP synthase subunit a n=1 Tax=Polyplacotoma mediterranea TaxID=2283839 RepID=A0A481YLY0_9METZ|nr:ATP synthase F0 subunit 6 [Polyplacotoma mediterranea]QBK82175.1 ATP synthase F0 subunit 6 [Polyplacotoma mediterranea]
MVAAYFDQFNIIPIFSIWIYCLSIWTNGEFFCLSNSLFMFFFILFIYNIISAPQKIVPNRIVVGLEIIYDHFNTVLLDNLGYYENGTNNKKRGGYLAFVLSLFFIILFCNGLGLYPYVFTPTVHIIITLGISVSIIIGITITCCIVHGLNFVSMLMPQGAPLALAPLLTIIETLSYISRAISLGVRLAANISSGHLLFSIIASFLPMALAAGMLGSALVPLTILFLVTVLEMAVAIIQAYVFTLLTIVYLRDTVELH